MDVVGKMEYYTIADIADLPDGQRAELNVEWGSGMKVYWEWEQGIFGKKVYDIYGE